jgi:hypothetical protein
MSETIKVDLREGPKKVEDNVTKVNLSETKPEEQETVEDQVVSSRNTRGNGKQRRRSYYFRRGYRRNYSRKRNTTSNRVYT